MSYSRRGGSEALWNDLEAQINASTATIRKEFHKMFKEMEIRTESDIRDEAKETQDRMNTSTQILQAKMNTFIQILSNENAHVRRDYNNHANTVKATSDKWESRFRHLSSQWKQEDWRNKCGNMHALWIAYTAFFFCLITSVIILVTFVPSHYYDPPCGCPRPPNH